MAWDYTLPWFHGSPTHLTTLRAGSTITQDRDLARIFSHKPPLVSQDTNAAGARIIKHTGVQPGLLYQIDEPIQPGDVYPHPDTTMGPNQEWLTTRDLRVTLLGPTQIIPHELLTEDEIATLRSTH